MRDLTESLITIALTVAIIALSVAWYGSVLVQLVTSQFDKLPR